MTPSDSQQPDRILAALTVPAIEPLLTLREIATWVNVHERTVRKWIEAKVLPATRLVPSGDYRIERADVRRCILGKVD